MCLRCTFMVPESLFQSSYMGYTRCRYCTYCNVCEGLKLFLEYCTYWYIIIFFVQKSLAQTEYNQTSEIDFYTDNTVYGFRKWSFNSGLINTTILKGPLEQKIIILQLVVLSRSIHTCQKFTVVIHSL